VDWNSLTDVIYFLRVCLGGALHVVLYVYPSFSLFFFNDTATTEIYTLSLHDALPIFGIVSGDDDGGGAASVAVGAARSVASAAIDRKSTRLNSSHLVISYAVFCLKKKKIKSNLSSIDQNTITRLPHYHPLALSPHSDC